MQATNSGDVESMRLLLDRGAAINRQVGAGHRGVPPAGVWLLTPGGCWALGVTGRWVLARGVACGCALHMARLRPLLLACECGCGVPFQCFPSPRLAASDAQGLLPKATPLLACLLWTVQDNSGWSALLLACRGQPAATRLLLERGAATDLQSSHGNSALMLAADFGAVRQLRMLLACGAALDSTNRRAACKGPVWNP